MLCYVWLCTLDHIYEYSGDLYNVSIDKGSLYSLWKLGVGSSFDMIPVVVVPKMVHNPVYCRKWCWLLKFSSKERMFSCFWNISTLLRQLGLLSYLGGSKTSMLRFHVCKHFCQKNVTMTAILPTELIMHWSRRTKYTSLKLSLGVIYYHVYVRWVSTSMDSQGHFHFFLTGCVDVFILQSQTWSSGEIFWDE